MTICKQGLGSNHVDLGGSISLWLAFSKMVVRDGDLTKKTGK
jgi:hypothetical protein